MSTGKVRGREINGESERLWGRKIERRERGREKEQWHTLHLYG